MSFKRQVQNLFFSCIEGFLRNRNSSLGYRMRSLYYKKMLKHCGRNLRVGLNVKISGLEFISLGDDVWIDHDAIIMAGPVRENRKMHKKAHPHYFGLLGHLEVGSRVHIGPQVILQAHGGCSIGSDLTIASGAKIYTVSHHYKNTTDPTDTKRYYFGSTSLPENQFLICAPVVIENFTAVGMNSILLPGAYLPEGTWVGVQMTVRNQIFQPWTAYSLKQEIISSGKNE